MLEPSKKGQCAIFKTLKALACSEVSVFGSYSECDQSCRPAVVTAPPMTQGMPTCTCQQQRLQCIRQQGHFHRAASTGTEYVGFANLSGGACRGPQAFRPGVDKLQFENAGKLDHRSVQVQDGNTIVTVGHDQVVLAGVTLPHDSWAHLV
jgi:hypothetical protein